MDRNGCWCPRTGAACSSSLVVLAGLVAAGAAGSAGAQAVPREDRGPLLMSNQGSPPVDGIFAFADGDGDGLALQPSEGRVFFDRTNAEGHLGPESNFLSIFGSVDGSAWAFDDDTNAVYRLEDQNGDGDANDAGESAVFFDGANEAGIEIASVNGLHQDGEGRLYLAHAATNVGVDSILQLRDQNGDGDANDAGEASVWADLSSFGGDAIPFELAFGAGAEAFLVDWGASPDAVYRLADEDDSGEVESDERSVWLSEGSFGVAIGFAIAVDGADVYLADNGGDDQGVWRCRDADGSGAIDAASEVVRVWSEAGNADGVQVSTTFDFALGAAGRVILLDSASEDRIVQLRDANGDGDFNDAGEGVVYAAGAVHGFDRPRSAAFLPGADAGGALAEVLGFDVVFGSWVSGEVGDLLESDDASLRARSELGFTAMEPNVMEVVIDAATDVPAPTTLRMRVEERYNQPIPGTSTLRVRDRSSGSFEPIGTFPLSNVDAVHETGEVDAAEFVGASGEIEASIKHVAVATFSAIGFDSFLDLVEIEVE